MWELIRKYWDKILLISFSLSVLFFTLIFILNYIVGRQKENFSDSFFKVVGCAIIFFIISNLVMMLFYWQKSYVTPKSRQTNFQKKPFIDFLENGYVLEGDFIVGYKDGFTVLLTYDAQPYICVRVKIPCNTGDERTLEKQKYLNGFLKKVKWWQNITDFWTPYAFTSEIPYVFKLSRLVTYAEVVQKINEMILIIKSTGLAPLDKVAYFKLSQE